MTGSRTRPLRAALLLAMLVTPLSAHAQPSAADRTQAEALFNEGKKLQKEGKIAEACRKFEGSYKIDPAGGTVLNLGLCHEKEGKIASAWGELKEALAAAKKANRKDREKIARERIDAIEPRLPFMIVIPDKPFDGLAVTVDGSAIASEAWGAQLPIDPGTHAVKATGPKHDAWEGSFDAAEGKKITVRIPALAEAAEPAPTATAPAAPVVMVPKYPWMRPSGIAIASVGVAALIVGSVFGANALAAGQKASSACDASFACTQAGFDAVQSGRTSAFAADILLGAGAGFAALGAVFFFVGGATTPATPAVGAGPRIRPTARIAPSGGSLGLEGAW
ncbi:MAG: hypothetical protein U0441_24575 [Polyangiaceae bacterium]